MTNTNLIERLEEQCDRDAVERCPETIALQREAIDALKAKTKEYDELKDQFDKAVVSWKKNEDLQEKQIEALQATLENTKLTITRQLELISERAPGEFLNKRPVVQSLQSHVRNIEKALAAMQKDKL